MNNNIVLLLIQNNYSIIIPSLKQAKTCSPPLILRYLHRQILHIFGSFLVVVLWIISIYHYIDSIPQFLRN